jgi:hypothetical protein
MFEFRFARVKEDAIDSNSAGLPDVLGHSLRIDCHVLLHGLLFDNNHVDAQPTRHVTDLNRTPDLLATLAEAKRRGIA